MKTFALFLLLVVAVYARQLTLANNLNQGLVVHVTDSARVGFDHVTTVPALDVRTWSIARDSTHVSVEGLLPSEPLPAGHVYLSVGPGSATIAEVSGPVESDGEPSPAALVSSFVVGFLTVFGYGVWGSIKRMFREAD